MYRQAGLVESGEHTAQPGCGATAYDHCGCMCGWPAHGCLEQAHTLFGDHDGVEPASAKVEGKATRFPNGVTDACKLLGMIVHQVPGAQPPARLLITQDSQHDVAWRHEALRRGPQQGAQRHGYSALVIQAAAPPDAAIHHSPLEGRILPGLVRGGHHVYVAVEQQRRRITSPGQAGNEIRAGRVASENGGLDSYVRQQAIYVTDAFRFIARWVSGVEANEFLQQFDWTLIDRRFGFRHTDLLLLDEIEGCSPLGDHVPALMWA